MKTVHQNKVHQPRCRPNIVFKLNELCTPTSHDWLSPVTSSASRQCTSHGATTKESRTFWQLLVLFEQLVESTTNDHYGKPSATSSRQLPKTLLHFYCFVKNICLKCCLYKGLAPKVLAMEVFCHEEKVLVNIHQTLIWRTVG